jgi:uncharacterized protein YbjT (DUF2867 family)
MIVVTGATGRLGSQIVQQLLTRVPADQVGVSVRDASRATALVESGVRVREGDFTDPASLAHAFEGATQVLVVSAAIRGHDPAVAANRAAVDAAHAAGSRRILYTSHQACSAGSLFQPMSVHAATEEHLSRVGTSYVCLRNGFYAGTLEVYLPQALTTGRITVPEDGPVSWTSHPDLAEVAAVALTRDDAVDGVTPPLVAPRTWTFEQIATELSDVLGRTVTRVVVGDDEWKASMVQRGLPPQAADFSLGMFRAARRGEFDVVDPTLETLIGHRATPVRATLETLARAV